MILTDDAFLEKKNVKVCCHMAPYFTSTFLGCLKRVDRVLSCQRNNNFFLKQVYIRQSPCKWKYFELYFFYRLQNTFYSSIHLIVVTLFFLKCSLILVSIPKKILSCTWNKILLDNTKLDLILFFKFYSNFFCL